MDSCSWLLRDWKFLKMSTKIGRERVIEVYTNVLDIGRGHLLLEEIEKLYTKEE